jgi:methyltransferase (TIGR00027 family)
MAMTNSATGTGVPHEHLKPAKAVGSASITAIAAALARAAHVIFDPDPIFVDPIALEMSGVSENDVRAIFESIPPACGRVARLATAQRGRFVDEAVQAAVARGINQFVILGAGLDTFGWRRKDLIRTLRVYEIDRPETQRLKVRRLLGAGYTLPAALSLIGIDLLTPTGFELDVVASGFDVSVPSIWSTAGLFVYLPTEVVQAMFETIARASAPGSELVGSFVVNEDLMDAESREFNQFARAASASYGEPHLTFLDPQEIEKMGSSSGWKSVRVLSPSTLSGWFNGRTDGLTPASYEWLFTAEL